MFQLSRRKIIFFLITFTIVSILITIGAIYYARTFNIAIHGELVKESGIDLNGTYDENDIQIENIKEETGTGELNYIKISGLKNKEIENSINTRIKNKASNFENFISDLNVYTENNSSCYISANFANVLSISIYKNVKIGESYEGFQEYINFDLTTGNELKFEDLFVKGADIDAILRNVIYKNLMSQSFDWEKGWEQTIYEIDENKLISIMNKYKKLKNSNNIKFGFSHKYIIIYINDGYAYSIPMENYADNIAIYNRYRTSRSIYERDNIDVIKGMFNLGYLDKGEKNYFGMMADNLLVDIRIFNWYGREDTEIINTYVDKYKAIIEEEIENEKEYANENKDIFIYYTKSYSIDNSENYNVITITERGEKTTMTKQYYNEVFKDRLAQTYRKTGEGGGITDFYENDYIMWKVEENKTTVEKYGKTRQFNTETGKEIEELGDLFKSRI